MLYLRHMAFAFSWELPAAVIGAAAVCVAGFAFVTAVARAHHGPSHAELAILGVLAIAGMWTWSTRDALAQRFFPGDTQVLDERVASQILTHGDCAAYVAATGEGSDDGSTCTVRVWSMRGRYVAPTAPRKSFESPCDVTKDLETRTWTFTVGSLKDWCEFTPR